MLPHLWAKAGSLIAPVVFGVVERYVGIFDGLPEAIGIAGKLCCTDRNGFLYHFSAHHHLHLFDGLADFLGHNHGIARTYID